MDGPFSIIIIIIIFTTVQMAIKIRKWSLWLLSNVHMWNVKLFQFLINLDG
jgi:hypothetical protein